jgi:hypothetical protein
MGPCIGIKCQNKSGARERVIYKEKARKRYRDSGREIEI